jgi:hypothetical protein
MDAAAAGCIPDCLEQHIRIGAKTAINHERAVFTVQGYHIATGSLNKFEAAEIGSGYSRASLWSAG